MKSMTYILEERIGHPALFCGRKKELDLLMSWISWIPQRGAKSRALLGRRKSGKTAIMQRLYNILWSEHGQVVPFYFEVKDRSVKVQDLAKDYFTTFLTQYLSFVQRTPLPENNVSFSLEKLTNLAHQANMPDIIQEIEGFWHHYNDTRSQLVIDYAFARPQVLAAKYDIRFLVMIDEIQYMTKYIYGDDAHTIQLYNLPGAFHGLVESKIAPMLVSGSYVGWMARMMQEMFVGGRLKWTPISPKLAEEEGLQAIQQYAEFYQQPITEESAVVMNELTQSDSFYIACLFTSDSPERDLSTPEGVIKTLDYEIETESSELRRTWSEYVDNTIREVNDVEAKRILLLLSRERHKELTRRDIMQILGLTMTDKELERKLNALVFGDLIGRGQSDFRYKGIPDDILDRVFRHRYQDEIEHHLPELKQEMTMQVEELKRAYQSLMGKYNELKGRMLEFLVHRELQRYSKASQPIANFRSRFRPALSGQAEIATLLDTFEPRHYQEVWLRYYFQIQPGSNNELDVLAENWAEECYSGLLFEVKNRDKARPTQAEAEAFGQKVGQFKAWIAARVQVRCEIGAVYFSANGFEAEVESWLHAHGILTTDAEYWGIE